MPLILPPGVPLVVASPPALLAPGAPSVLPAPYVLRHPAPSARALEELAEGVRRERREWDPRPWWMRPAWPDPPPLMQLDSNDKVFLSQGDDFSDLKGRPGLNFVVIGSVSGKTVRVTGAGTQASPIVLRGASDDDSSGGANYPELVNCTGDLFATASTRCILYRFRCRGCHLTPSGYDYCRIARCRFYGNNVGGNTVHTIEITASSDNLRVDRCVAGSLGAFKSIDGFLKLWKGGNVECCYNHALDYLTDAGQVQGNIMSVVYGANTGLTPVDKRPGFGLWGHHTLCSGTTGPVGANFSEFKLTDGILSDNTTLYDVAGGPGMNMRLRHGLRNRIERNLTKYLGGGRGGGDIQARDVEHWVGENASLNADGTINAATEIVLKGGNLDADTWLQHRVAGVEHNWENCKRTTVGGNAMNVVVGAAETTYPDTPTYYPADGNVVPPDLRADGNASSVLDPRYQSNTDRLPGGTLKYRLAAARSLVALGPTDVGLALP